MLKNLLFLSILVSIVALLYARWEYRTRGKLSLLGLFLLCAMLLVPNVLLDAATRYRVPASLLQFLGLAIGAGGLALCLYSVLRFRSITKVLCLDTGELTLDGPYRWGRNPQYVGWWLFLLGFALTDWSLWCLATLVVLAVSLHFLVMIEEEHLERVFGELYLEFCRKVPRYLGWRRA